MISGLVNQTCEATIRLGVQDAKGQPHEVEAVIDTGFTGFPSLPPSMIAALGMPWLCRQQGLLADGSIQVFDVHAGTVIWDGLPRSVEIDADDAQPLVGMGLMQGYELLIRVVVGGDVRLAGITP